MPTYQITCITKPNRQSTHEAITHLGNSGGKFTRSQVIDKIDAGTDTFFTMLGGKRADIHVRERNGTKYVQTAADGYYNDNLLALDECS
jgi:hypothetical protein